MSAAPALTLPFEPASSASDGTIERALRSVREHLGMQIAYVSEFVGNQTVFRQVDAPGLEHLIKVGDAHSLDDVYCRHILEGRIPSLMADTSQVPFAAAMPITAAVPIGKHMSIPLRLKDGEVYGMFCCLGPAADPSLNERDLATMRVFADFAAQEVRKEVEAKREAEAKLARIMSVMNDGQMSIVYQPICDVQAGSVLGFECLTRFRATPYRTPDVWFKEAGEVSYGAVLETAAIKLALEGLSALPDHIYLGVNASPDTITWEGFASVFDGLDTTRIVLEVTEHAEVKDYEKLVSAVSKLRRRGIKLAIDDAGAGYSGLQHILKLQPDTIKLDLALTRNIDKDLARRALASALVNFASATSSEIVAEGVETEFELQSLKELGVQKAQGYYLGRPSSLIDAQCSVAYGLPVNASGKPQAELPKAPTLADWTFALCGEEYGLKLFA